MLEINKIHLGDCMTLMPQIPNESIDLILCDLPYGITQNTWDSIIPLPSLWEEYQRILKNNRIIILTAMQPFSSQLVLSNLKLFKYEWIWSKNKSTGFLNAKKAPLRAHEQILVFSKGKARYYPQKTFNHAPVHFYTKHTTDGTNYGMTRLNISGGGSTERYPTSILIYPVETQKMHPTQKPVKLFEYLIKTYTNENDIVLDNCIGSGTTAVAAKNLKRNFIGIEKEEKYWKLAIERVNNIKV